jgi:hypothetical protein
LIVAQPRYDRAGEQRPLLGRRARL